MKKKHCTRPCADCPFRKDTMKGWLGAERMQGIINDTSFVCHKTTGGADNERKQCAGFMLIKQGESAYEKIARALKIDLGLKGRELVFETEQDCITHHTTD